MARPEKSRLDRLPGWARQYVNKLEDDNRELRRNLTQLREGQEPGPISLGRVPTAMIRHADPDANNTFYLPGDAVCINHAGIEMEVVCIREGRGEGHSEEIRVYFDPDRRYEVPPGVRAAIMPSASNAFSLVMAPHQWQSRPRRS